MARLTALPSLLAPARGATAPPADRPSARSRGYISRWDRESKAFLRANPLCRGCLALGRTAASTLTDHVVPHKGSTAIFWDTARWQASCTWHHNTVKQLLEQRFETGEILAEDLWLDSEVAVQVARRNS